METLNDWDNELAKADTLGYVDLAKLSDEYYKAVKLYRDKAFPDCSIFYDRSGNACIGSTQGIIKYPPQLEGQLIFERLSGLNQLLVLETTDILYDNEDRVRKTVKKLIEEVNE
jgi:hypothetical protein